MTTENNKPADAPPPTIGVQARAQLALRQRAEAMIQKSAAHSRGYIESMTREKPDRILHELHVHQIELEMQNQTLMAAQIAMEASRDRFVDFYECAPVGYLTLTDRGLIADINQTGAALLGAERGKLLQQPFARFVSPDDADRWHLHFMSVKKRDGKLNCDLALHPREGAPAFVRLDSLRLIKDGQALTVRVVLTDITERKQAERMLTASVAELRMANENIKLAERAAQAGAYNWNFKTGETKWSTEFFRLFGLDVSNNKASYETWQAALHPDDRQKAEMEVAEAIRDRKSFVQEYRAVLPGGGTRWIAGHGDLLCDDTGQPQSLIGFCIDITERKHAEAELTQYRNELEAQVLARTASLAQARDDAEAASRAKDIFLSTMSHEMRTPMQAVMGMTELVMLDITEPQQLNMLGRSQWGARRLLALINDVLDLSSSEADLLTLTEVNFSPRIVVDEIVAVQEEVVSAKQLRLVTEIDPAVAGVLRGDRLRFKEILLRFIDNAIKFSARGLITVRVHCGQQDRLTQWLRLEVSDEGIGIAPDQQARLFQAFTQVDGSLTRPYDGAGLGLILCRRIALLMGGDAGVSSVEGSGSTFWATVQLSLPGEATVSEEIDCLVSARDLLVRDFAGARVLVVEDELAYQELAVLVLESAGLTVAVAGNGQQALDMARQSAYDLILMDVHLPVRDGADAARAIRELPPMAGVPIIAMTSADFDRERDRSLITGMDDHVGKPVDFDVLCATVLHWLRKKSAVR